MTYTEIKNRLIFFKENDKIKKFFRKLNAKAVAESDIMLDKLIEAAEKQIPQKAKVVDEDTDSPHYICPVCGEWLEVPNEYSEPNYCEVCGQALSFKEDENDKSM